jgi:nitronate monooxygenase
LSSILDSLSVPIVLAPLAGGPSTPELAAAVASAGGLGFLAAGYLSADELAERLATARGLTSEPVAVNLFVPGAEADRPDAEALEAFLDRLSAWAEDRGIELGSPRRSDDNWDSKVELLLGEPEPPLVVSFTFGCPERALLERFKDAGSEVWVTVTSPEEAAEAEAAGAQALVVQGAEAGGHRGSFHDRPDLPVHGLLPLLALIAARTSLPLIASGGIATGRALAAVRCAGARAAQLGTAFLRCPEAGTSEAHRVALRSRTETALTRAFTGRLARGIRNEFLEEFSRDAPLAYPELHYVTAPMRRAARRNGDAELINLWAGEAHTLAEAAPAGEIVRRLHAEAQAALAALAPSPDLG